MKKCPFCAEEIQDEAIKCRFCQEMLKPIPSSEPRPTVEAAQSERQPELSQGGQNLPGLVVSIMGVVLLAYAFLLDTSVGTEAGRVNNLGLMQHQQMLLVVAMGTLVVGVLLWLFGPKSAPLRAAYSTTLFGCIGCVAGFLVLRRAESTDAEHLFMAVCGGFVGSLFGYAMAPETGGTRQRGPVGLVEECGGQLQRIGNWLSDFNQVDSGGHRQAPDGQNKPDPDLDLSLAPPDLSDTQGTSIG